MVGPFLGRSALSVSNSDVAELEQINARMTEEERRGAAGARFFETLLDDALVFRRGDGSVTDKAGFLAGLADPGNSSELLTSETRQLLVFEDQAMAEVVVELIGTRGGENVAGSFRNLRLFERQPGGWRCVMWFNKRAAGS